MFVGSGAAVGVLGDAVGVKESAGGAAGVLLQAVIRIAQIAHKARPSFHPPVL